MKSISRFFIPLTFDLDDVYKDKIFTEDKFMKIINN